MNTISINEIITYGYCPMLYKYLYVDNVKNSKISLQEEYNEAFKKTVYGFLVSSIDKNASFVNMKASWGRIWIKEKKTIEYIYSDPKSWRDSHNEKRKTGILSLKNFYDYYYSSNFYPILFNKAYSVDIKGLTLTGTFDIICDKEGEVEILSIKTSNRNFNTININKDIEITSMSYAFRKLFKVDEDSIIVFNSEKGNFVKTNRSENDYKEFIESVINIYKCIHNKIYYKCPSEKCFKCSCKSLCIK